MLLAMQYPKLILVKVSDEMKAEVRQRARSDDRTVSSYVRHLIANALASTKPGGGQ